ncbi:hypothetical protein [Streptococcus oricebi]|uniref:LXG domain-containing protein n=1 Tax=Streptococcus oricebi TaxID=1547447 RepID=A0ABS5B4P3_9STRE|nr:hypothetical protein [Streptococcus oricebi]MBP2623797.1 hypothetical protein [Streptococcus oricebi]
MVVSNGIMMDLAQSQDQAKNVAHMVYQQLLAYDDLQLALNEFVASTNQLKGRAYDSSRELIRQVLEPLRRGGARLSEATARLVQQLPDDYLEQVGSENLEEDSLREEINRWDGFIQEAEDMLSLARQGQRLEPTPANTQRVISLENSLEIYQTARQALVHKLERLMTFHQLSEEIFAEIAVLEQAVNIGLSQLNHAWDEKDLVFKLPQDLTWIRAIDLGIPFIPAQEAV